MPGLSDQRLIIDRLAHSAKLDRVCLIAACRCTDLPIEQTMVCAGTALMIADLTPGVGATSKFFFKNQQPGQRRKRLATIFLESPKMIRSVRRLLG